MVGKVKTAALDNRGNLVASLTESGWLKIFEGEISDDGVYMPPKNIVFTDDDTKNLKKFLNDNLPE